MTTRKPAPSDFGTDPSQPNFPPQRAFVVQFSQEADFTRGRYVGRVEHVLSGDAARFADSQELLKVITLMLSKFAGGGSRDGP